MAPKKTRTDATIKRLQSSVGFGPHIRGPASARLTRCLRGCTIIYNIKFGGSSSSSRRSSSSSLRSSTGSSSSSSST